MARRPTQRDIARALLRRHGRTYAEELGLALGPNRPTALFQLLQASLLFSARISAGTAVKAARALWRRGWRSPRKLSDATWEERTRTLNRAGYARYDERTSTMLADTARLALERYGGDLRRLREEAARDPAQERRLLKQFKGIGDAGADIFLRELQGVWDELFPFVDRRAQTGAHSLGLPPDGRRLARLVDRDEFPRLVAALVRTAIARDQDEVLAEA